MNFQSDVFTNSQFNWKIALALANCSKLAYQRKGSVESIATNQFGYSNCNFISQDATQLFVANTETIAVIAFRGTYGRADWLNNFRIFSTADAAFGRVHRGFHLAFQSVRATLVDYLNTLGSDKKIWVTGHSLGGALATLCMAELDNTHRSQLEACYTFGQPRLANQTFATFIDTQYENRFFRFVNDDDIVTRIPPGYQHLGKLIHFAPDGSLLASPHSSDTETVGLESTEADESLATTEAPELTTAEFEQFLLDNGEEQNLEFDSGLEGLLPSVTDHMLEDYIHKIAIHERLSDEVLQETSRSASFTNGGVIIEDITDGLEGMEGLEGLESLEAVETAEITEGGEDSTLYPVVIKAAENWVPPADIEVQSSIGTVHTARITLSQMDRLKLDTGNIFSVDESSEGFMLDTLTSVPFVKANQVHRPPLEEKGDKAIVGIIDTGIDVLHHAFTVVGNTKKSRILYVWDQNARSISKHTGQLHSSDRIAQFPNSCCSNQL